MFNIVAIFSRSRTKRALPFYDPLPSRAPIFLSLSLNLNGDSCERLGCGTDYEKSLVSVLCIQSRAEVKWEKRMEASRKRGEGSAQRALNEDLPNFFVNALFIFTLLLNVHISFGSLHLCNNEKSIEYKRKRKTIS